jgi:alpha-aminoadipate/glutamate carrier protein LysW
MEILTAPQCPECKAAVTVPDGAMVAEIVICGTCSSELEVIATGPAMLALAPEIEEDWGE